MFTYTISDDEIVLVFQGAPETVCHISSSVENNKISLTQTIMALQKFFAVNQVMTVAEPYCDLETLSVHGLVALVFSNLCCLTPSSTIASFLDTTIHLAADLITLQTKHNQVVETPNITQVQHETLRSFNEHCEPVICNPVPYRSLLQKLCSSSDNMETCTECDKVVDSVGEYRRHLVRDHLDVENWKMLLPGVARELKCDVCSIQFLDVSSFKQHLSLCTPPCTKEDLQRTLNAPSSTQSSKFCPLCRRTLCCTANYTRHLEAHCASSFDSAHNFASDEHGNCQPERDLILTTREARLYVAIKILQDNSNETTTATGQKGKVLLTCEECQFTTRSRSLLAHHLKIYHLGLDVLRLLDPNFLNESCAGCGVQFSCDEDKIIHQSWCVSSSSGCLEQLNEANLDKFRKEIEESFSLVPSIREEINKSKKNETKPLPEFDENSENVSGPKNLNQNSGLGRVIKKMKLKPKEDTDVLKKGSRLEHVCDMCGKVYLNVKSLRMHISIHHNKEREYKCTVCPKQFGRRDGLARHQRTHTREQNFVCEFCSRCFSQSSNLIKHRRIKHLDKARESYRFECEVCKGRYYSKNEMLKHVRISHDKAKDHRCLVCSMQFGGRAIVRRHIIKVHRVPDPTVNIHFQKLFDILENYQTCL